MRINKAVSKIARHRFICDIAAMYIEAVGEVWIIQQCRVVALVRERDDERQRGVGERQG